MTTSITLFGVGYDVGIGILLLLLDAAMTFLIVNRVVQRQEERKRRDLSGLVEARIAEALDGLLSDGLPSSCRATTPYLLTINKASVALQIRAIDHDCLVQRMQSDPRVCLRALEQALTRYRRDLVQPLNLVIIEPKLAPTLVALAGQCDVVAATLCDWARAASAQECERELHVLTPELVTTAWSLYQQIRDRWL